MAAMIFLEAQDHHFGWILEGGATPSSDGLRLPDGEADPPAILDLLRGHCGFSPRAGPLRHVADRAGGLGGRFLRLYAAIAQGAAEIGYGITASWRRQGLATQAVGALVTISTRRGLSLLTANTAVNNLASQRVLQNNGFVSCGARTDPEDGELLQWRLPLA